MTGSRAFWGVHLPLSNIPKLLSAKPEAFLSDIAQLDIQPPAENTYCGEASEKIALPGVSRWMNGDKKLSFNTTGAILLHYVIQVGASGLSFQVFINQSKDIGFDTFSDTKEAGKQERSVS